MILNDTKCWFCNKNNSTSDSDLVVTLQRSYTVGMYTKVEKTTVAIPRCQECKRIHGKIKSFVWKRASLIAVLSSILAGIFSDSNIFLPILIWGLIGLFIGFLFFRFFGEQKFLNGTNIAPESKAKEYPELKVLLKVGWQFKV